MKMENQFWFLEYDNTNRYDGDYEDYREYKYNKELHYDHNKKKWVKLEEYTGSWFPATFPCHSYKAAKRHLRKHNEIPIGTKFRLVNEFVGFDRFLTKKK